MRDIGYLTRKASRRSCHAEEGGRLGHAGEAIGVDQSGGFFGFAILTSRSAVAKSLPQCDAATEIPKVFYMLLDSTSTHAAPVSTEKICKRSPVANPSMAQTTTGQRTP